MASAKGVRSAASGGRRSGGTSVKKLEEQLSSSDKKLANMKAAAQRAKANASKAGKSLVHTGETVLTAGLSSAVSGFVPSRHRKYVRMGRVAAALLTGGAGLVRTLNGKDGCHLSAVSDGFAAAELSETAFLYANQMSAKKGWMGKSLGADGNVIGDAGFVPEVAVTPPAGQITDVGVQEVYPDDPALAMFRSKGLARARA